MRIGRIRQNNEGPHLAFFILMHVSASENATFSGPGQRRRCGCGGGCCDDEYGCEHAGREGGGKSDETLVAVAAVIAVVAAVAAEKVVRFV